jgi:hypothetical protein
LIELKKERHRAMATNRRRFLINSLGGTVSLSLASMVTGLPASFLLNRSVYAAEGVSKKPRFTIFCGSDGGESYNCSGPGSFPMPNQPNSPLHKIHRVARGTRISPIKMDIDGVLYDAKSLSTAAQINPGDPRSMGAQAFLALPESFRKHLVTYWHHTHTGSHGDFSEVLEAFGEFKGATGRNGVAQLPEILAYELAEPLGSVMSKPISLAKAGTYKANSAALLSNSPGKIKSIFNIDGDSNDFSLMRDTLLDNVYKDVVANGNSEQRKFMDDYAISRNAAVSAGDSLKALLARIVGNPDGDPLITLTNDFMAALVLVKAKMSPVVTMELYFSRDNHSDELMQQELTLSLTAIKGLKYFWDVANLESLADEINLVFFSIFGRTTSLNFEGRNHAPYFTAGFIHNTDLRGMVVGGAGDGLSSASINPLTGQVDENGIIRRDNSLSSFGKTILAAAGVSSFRQDERVPHGHVVRSIFS